MLCSNSLDKSSNENYGIKLNHIFIKCNNTSAIQLTKNSIIHSKTKHIEITHHFIREYVKKGDIELKYININDQLVNIFANL